MNFDEGTDWMPVGESYHTIYVTLAKPVTTLRQETLFYIGCKYAHGINTFPAMIDAVWNHIAGLEVRRAKDPYGKSLTYYGNYDVDSYTTSSLLALGDGRCGAWTKFFLDILKIHGFQQPNNLAVITHVDNKLYDERGFFIKSWDKIKQTSPDANYPCMNAYSPPTYINTNKKGYAWIDPDLNYLTDIKGQGNMNPSSIFRDHVLACVANINGNVTYYDPSYGKKFTYPIGNDGALLSDFQSAMIFGFYRRAYNTPSGQNSFLVKEVTPTVEIKKDVQEHLN